MAESSEQETTQTYATADNQADSAGHQKCSLCHICPTFLGICYFIWLAILVITITIILIILFRRKDDQKEKH